MECWRLIRSGPLPGGLNMAIDEVLLEAVASGRSAPVLRLYRWAAPTLTVGYAQKIAGHIDLEVCRRRGVEVLRRSTGGRAVLHDDEVTYAVLAPERSRIFAGSILGNYRIIAGVLQKLLASFGLSAHLAPVRRRGGEDAANCFLAPSACELLVDGCKVTGSAQRRSGCAFLQHGSIPLEIDLERLYRILHPGRKLSPETVEQSLGETVGWLNRWLSPRIGAEELERRLIEVFAAELRIAFEERDLTPGEYARARDLSVEKYINLAV